MTDKHLREMLAETLGMLGKLLPTANEGFTMAHAIYQATASQDPKRAVLIDSHFQRLLKPSKEPIAEVLATIAALQVKLNDETLWENH